MPQPTAPDLTTPPPRLSRPAVLVVLAVLASVLPLAVPAGAVEDVRPARISGVTRDDTAARIAALAFPEGVDTAVVATTVDFADSLVGAGLAGSLVAAQLLVAPDQVPGPTAQALQDLGVEQVVIVGGPQAVSAEVEQALAADYEVRRLSGETPEATAAVVAAEIVAGTGVPEVDGQRTVFVANGTRFPDALAGSIGAFRAQAPILYADGDGLPPETVDFLQANEIEQVVVLGGTQAVPASAEDQMTDAGVTTITRLQGATRVETSLAVADWLGTTFDFSFDGLLVARGDDFPDALTVAQYGARISYPVLLTADPGNVTTSLRDWLVDHCGSIELVAAVGGEAAVTRDALDTVEASSECTPAEPQGPQPDFTMEPAQAREVAAGTTVQVQVTGRADGSALDGPLDVVLFPCAGSEVTGGSHRFADADDDDAADGFGTTDTGNAVITHVNGEDVQDGPGVASVAPQDGTISVQLDSSDADCAIVVVVDGNGNGQLDLDADGHPVEDHGATLTRWT